MSLNAAANVYESQKGEIPSATSTEAKTRSGTMKALQWFGKENVSVQEVPIPDITDDDDVICKVTGTTVCGSDLHLYHKEIMELKEGDILGHEWCGVVEKIGRNVKRFKPGDRVVSSFQVSCGQCFYCKQKLTSMCNRTGTSQVQTKMYGDKMGGIFGYSHFTGGYAGGQAEYARAPFAEENLLKIPKNVPDEKALYLSDIVPTSYHSVVRAEVDKGKTVAIWGLGPIGLLATKWSQVKGASKIIVVDNVPERIAKAKTIATNETEIISINFDEEKDVAAKILELVPHGVDCSIDCAAFRYTKGILHTAERALGLETDSSEILNEEIRATRKFGNISLIADYVGYTNHFLIGAVMEKGLTLRGGGQAPVQKYWHELLHYVENGSFDPTFILTHRFKIDEMKEVYEAFDLKKNGILKTFVETKFSNPPAPHTPPLTSAKDLL